MSDPACYCTHDLAAECSYRDQRGGFSPCACECHDLDGGLDTFAADFNAVQRALSDDSDALRQIATLLGSPHARPDDVVALVREERGQCEALQLTLGEARAENARLRSTIATLRSEVVERTAAWRLAQGCYEAARERSGWSEHLCDLAMRAGLAAVEAARAETRRECAAKVIELADRFGVFAEHRAARGLNTAPWREAENYVRTLAKQLQGGTNG